MSYVSYLYLSRSVARWICVMHIELGPAHGGGCCCCCCCCGRCSRPHFVWWFCVNICSFLLITWQGSRQLKSPNPSQATNHFPAIKQNMQNILSFHALMQTIFSPPLGQPSCLSLDAIKRWQTFNGKSACARVDGLSSYCGLHSRCSAEHQFWDNIIILISLTTFLWSWHGLNMIWHWYVKTDEKDLSLSAVQQKHITWIYPLVVTVAGWGVDPTYHLHSPAMQNTQNWKTQTHTAYSINDVNVSSWKAYMYTVYILIQFIKYYVTAQKDSYWIIKKIWLLECWDCRIIEVSIRVVSPFDFTCGLSDGGWAMLGVWRTFVVLRVEGPIIWYW